MMTRRMSRVAALAAVSATALALSACSGGASATGAGAVEVKLSIPDPIGSSVGTAAQHFADVVKSKSNGSVKVTIIPNGTSFGGDQNAAVTRVQSGSLDAVILSTSVYAGTNKKMNAVSLPYLFSSVDQEVKYLNGAPGKELLADLSQHGTKGLAMLSRTPREVTNSVRPIQTPDDLKGLKIRVPGNPLWTKFFSAVGASPTPLAFSEVYTALQTGAISGQENPVEVPATSKFAEVQKYLSMTNHMEDAFVLAFSDKKWSGQDSNAQQALQAAADDTAAFKTKNDADQAEQQVKQLQSQGMKVNDVSPDGAAQFKKIARSLYPEFADVVGGADFLKKTVDFVDGK